MSDGLHTLVGQYDSPFLRRVAVTMHHYGIAYDRKVLSVFSNADEVAEVTPLIKVPVLLLPDGEPIFDSQFILDYLDEQAPEGTRLTPASGPKRRAVLQAVAIGWGIAEKSVALSVDRNLHGNSPSLQWRHRCRHQIKLCLEWLENRAPDQGWMIDGTLSQADISLTAALDHVAFRHPTELKWDAVPKLKRIRDAAAELDCFKAVPLIEG